jgi:hypothetical protein
LALDPGLLDEERNAEMRHSKTPEGRCGLQPIKATLAVVLTLGILLTGCGSHDSKASKSEASPSVTRSTKTPVSDIVGRWARVVKCQELTQDLDAVGLGPLTAYAWLGQTSSNGQSSFASGSPQPTTTHPCTGALPRQHSHFFTSAGQFGSVDWLGGQVDDGQYAVTGDSTLKIGKVTFDYRVVHNTLRLAPVLTKAMVRKALARPKEFSDAGWAVSVAYPGQTWKRVACGQWC